MQVIFISNEADSKYLVLCFQEKMQLSEEQLKGENSEWYYLYMDYGI